MAQNACCLLIPIGEVWKKGREEGRKEGREEGRKEGVKEGRADVARNLLSIGMTLEDIAKVTGLEIQDIEQLNN